MKAQVVSLDPLELRRSTGELVARSFEVRGNDDYGSYTNHVPYDLGIQLKVGQEFDFQTGELNGIEV